MEGIGSMMLQWDLFQNLQFQGKLASSADKFMFRADSCAENASWDGHIPRMSCFKSIRSSTQRTLVRSAERRFVWNEDDAEGPNSCLDIYRC